MADCGAMSVATASGNQISVEDLDARIDKIGEAMDDAKDKAESVVEFCQSEKQAAERDLAAAQDAPGDTPAASNYKGGSPPAY